MRVKLVRIGNSRGIRLPKPLIDDVGLGEFVQLHVRGATIVIAPERTIRAGWADAAKQANAAGVDVLEGAAPTSFEADEWQW